jgi:hypothetical protein
LGHIISKKGIEVDPDKVQTVRDFPVPRNATEVHAFQGLFNYFRRFIPNFDKIANVLTDLEHFHRGAEFSKIDMMDHFRKCQSPPRTLFTNRFRNHFANPTIEYFLSQIRQI